MRQILSTLLCGFLLLSSVPADAVLWNKVIAVYNEEILTLWDIKREIQLQRIQSGHPELSNISQNDQKAMTKKIIVESLVIKEAESFKIGSLTPQEKTKAFKAFKRKFKSEHLFQNFLREYHWSTKEIKKALERSVHVEKFIKEKILSAYIFITDEEVKTYQEKVPTFSSDAARKRLRKLRVQENLRDWIQGLKLRNDIRTIWD